MEQESWITAVYNEFWEKANELARKEGGNISGNRSKHLDSMKEMFIATMLAPEAQEDCGGEDVGTCDGCTSLPQCQERWRITKQN